MLVHAVYFWLKPDLTQEQIKTFEKLAEAMGNISCVTHLWVGKPAATDRPVIDRTYSYGLVVALKDMAAHDEYQVHPLHDSFRETCGSFWTQVKIYDQI